MELCNYPETNKISDLSVHLYFCKVLITPGLLHRPTNLTIVELLGLVGLLLVAHNRNYRLS